MLKLQRHIIRYFKKSCFLFRIEPFYIPDPGEGIHEVEILEWKVKPGSLVKESQVLCEARSDKKISTYTSIYEGVIKNVFQEVEKLARVGDKLYEIEIDDQKYPVKAAADKDVFKKKFQMLKSKESPAESKPAEQQIQKSTPAVSSQQERKQEKNEISEIQNEQRMSPAAKFHMDSKGIKANQVIGTGKRGMITKEDVINYQQFEETITPSVLKQPTAPQQSSQVKEEKPQKIHTQQQPIKEVQQPIKEVQQPKQTQQIQQPQQVQLFTLKKEFNSSIQYTESGKVPTFVYSDELEVSQVLEFLKQQKQEIGWLAIFIKALSGCIKKFPLINAQFTNEQFTEYILIHNQNIGILSHYSEQNSENLQIPVIEEVQSKTIQQISDSLKSLKVTTQPTITILQHRGTVCYPPVFPPQFITIGIGQIRKKLKFTKNKELKEVEVVDVSWAADHRLIEGAYVARTNNLISEIMQDPQQLIFHL